MRSVPIAQIPGALAGQGNIKDTSMKMGNRRGKHLPKMVKVRVGAKTGFDRIKTY